MGDLRRLLWGAAYGEERSKWGSGYGGQRIGSEWELMEYLEVEWIIQQLAGEKEMITIKGELVGKKMANTSKGMEYGKLTMISKSSDGNTSLIGIYDYNGRSRHLKVGEIVEIEVWCTAYVTRGGEGNAQVKYVAIKGDVAGMATPGGDRKLGVAV